MLNSMRQSLRAVFFFAILDQRGWNMKQIITFSLLVVILSGLMVSFAETVEVIGEAEGTTGIFVESAGFLGLSLTTWIIILAIILLLVALRFAKLRQSR